MSLLQALRFSRAAERLPHRLRTFATAADKTPREGLWLTGVALFGLGGGLLFTGTILTGR